MDFRLNFHPGRVSAGMPILEALARDGAYHAQFVTGTSNGGVTAHPGGDRTRWGEADLSAARTTTRRRSSVRCTVP